MKWFKHETDATSNLKMQLLINKFGLEGYGYYWSLLELVAAQGKNFKLKGEQQWKVYLKKNFEIDIPKQDLFLEFLSDNHFIDKPSYANGDLYIPKMEKRSDNYTRYGQEKKLQSNFKETTNLLNLEVEEEVEEKKNRKEEEESIAPSKLTKQFFKDLEIQDQLVIQIAEKYPDADKQLIKRELKKFIEYWTAPLQSGKKQLWETKPTFVVSLRFQNWLNNIKSVKSERRIIS